MQTPGSLGVEGKGKAPHWRLTELGYRRDLPTRDFAHWDGKPFTDRKTKSRAPIRAHPVREMAHTSVPEMERTAEQKRAGNGAHIASADPAGIQHISRLTTPTLQKRPASDRARRQDDPPAQSAGINPVLPENEFT